MPRQPAISHAARHKKCALIAVPFPLDEGEGSSAFQHKESVRGGGAAPLTLPRLLNVCVALSLKGRGRSYDRRSRCNGASSSR